MSASQSNIDPIAPLTKGILHLLCNIIPIKKETIHIDHHGRIKLAPKPSKNMDTTEITKYIYYFFRDFKACSLFL